MKRITYKTMMKKIEDGYTEVMAWGAERNGNTIADVIFYRSNGTARREVVEVTGMPAATNR